MSSLSRRARAVILAALFAVLVVACSIAGDDGDGAAGVTADGAVVDAGEAAARAAETTTTVATTTTAPPIPTPSRTMALRTRITGELTPKSVVASGKGHVVAQNMIYTHTVSVYDDAGTLLATIPDTVDLAAFGLTGYPPGEVQGGPVEAAFAPDGRHVYVSNYAMYGPGFGNPGDDVCSPSSGYDDSFAYRIDLTSMKVDQVIPVGSVPKYVAVSPDGRLLLVTNWCSYDLSVIDTATAKEVQRLPMGPYPRGIVVDPTSSTAYVAVMGSTEVKTVDLRTFEVGSLGYVGSGPRHVVMSPDGSTLYVTLNAEGNVAKVDAATGEVLGKVATGAAPRSMDISADGLSLYVVNYDSGTMSKLATDDLSVLQELPTDAYPIGITYDRATGEVWVACYGGSLLVFADA